MFLSHAAPVLIMGPESVMGQPNDSHKDSKIAHWYQGLPKQLGLVGENKPKALLFVSAHYETGYTGPALVTSHPNPPLYYDYYGFPKYTYDVKYPAPGSPGVAARVEKLLTEAGIACKQDAKRGLDHGSFIPLMHAYPEADIPVVQLSIFNNYDPAMHVKMGVALRQLRKEGVFIIGSGQATHGALYRDAGMHKKNVQFLDALTDGLRATGSADPATAAAAAEGDAGKLANDSSYLKRFFEEKRTQTVLRWHSLPYASVAHPSDDHFIPMATVVGAALPEEEMKVVGDHWMLGLHSLRTFVFGKTPADRAAAAGAAGTKDEL